MYGCKYVGFDDYCDTDASKGLGYRACGYFVVFILTGVYLLVTLFVGVIIKSMELLQKSVAEENEILTKVYRQQSEFGYGPLALTTLLEVFDMLDQSANGVLTVGFDSSARKRSITLLII